MGERTTVTKTKDKPVEVHFILYKKKKSVKEKVSKTYLFYFFTVFISFLYIRSDITNNSLLQCEFSKEYQNGPELIFDAKDLIFEIRLISEKKLFFVSNNR